MVHHSTHWKCHQPVHHRNHLPVLEVLHKIREHCEKLLLSLLLLLLLSYFVVLFACFCRSVLVGCALIQLDHQITWMINPQMDIDYC